MCMDVYSWCPSFWHKHVFWINLSLHGIPEVISDHQGNQNKQIRVLVTSGCPVTSSVIGLSKSYGASRQLELWFYLYYLFLRISHQHKQWFTPITKIFLCTFDWYCKPQGHLKMTDRQFFVKSNQFSKLIHVHL